MLGPYKGCITLIAAGMKKSSGKRLNKEIVDLSRRRLTIFLREIGRVRYDSIARFGFF
jgi:hypothetical protein